MPINKKIKLAIVSFLLLGTVSSGHLSYALDDPAAVPESAVFPFGPGVRQALAGAALGDFQLNILPDAFSSSTDVELKKIDGGLETPWQLNRLSAIYQFDVKNKAAYAGGKPLYIQIKYGAEDNFLKTIYFFDKNKNLWRPLLTKDNYRSKTATAPVNFGYAQVALFSNRSLLAAGQASWYKHKGGDFAASPDFPRGARLRVYAVPPQKGRKEFVDVTVNDYGPDRKVLPDVVVDLDKAAFAKIASLGQGKIAVRVEPLTMPSSEVRARDFRPLVAPAITAKSALLINEESGEVLYGRNATSTLPLASLTKLAAMKVFLDTKPDLKKIVAYDVRDEEYNYRYVEHKWESARLKVKSGETMTVENLIYAALVGSANNAVETLVRVSGLSRDDFIRQMNQSAVIWGASSTYFLEPTGLSPENVSSPQDYAAIAKAALAHPVIVKASAASDYVFETINTKAKHRLRNTNHLILYGANFAINGSKTGYLEEAGYCLMTRAKLNQKENLIAIVFGVASRDKSFAETKDLILYGLKQHGQVGAASVK